MNWNPITEKPEEGRPVWMLTRTFNRIFPDGFKIIGGVIAHRDTGWWGLKSDKSAWACPYSPPESNFVLGWLYAEDFSPLPEWFTEEITKS